MRNLQVAPERASNFGLEFDLLFYTITALTIVFTIIVGLMIVIFIAKYKRGKRADRSRPVHDHLRLELTWTIIPLILGIAMFVWGTKIYLDQRRIPSDAYQIYVIGKQWMWHAQHPNGILENNELHLPVGVPVHITMISQDVIHGFYIPAFRQQYHVVPGRYTDTWFIPTREGRYHLFCTIHCGTQHSEMGGYVYVLSQKDFAEWQARGGNRFLRPALTMAQKGEQIWKDMACGNCHGEVDTPRGPTLVGLFGKERLLADGRRKVADQAYVRDGILNPYKELLAGYTQTMPVYQGQLSEEQVLMLMAYIRSLGGSNPNDATSPRRPGEPQSIPTTEVRASLDRSLPEEVIR